MAELMKRDAIVGAGIGECFEQRQIHIVAERPIVGASFAMTHVSAGRGNERLGDFIACVWIDDVRICAGRDNPCRQVVALCDVKDCVGLEEGDRAMLARLCLP